MADRTFSTPVALALIAGTIFVLNLGGTQLWDDDEPKNATCGREMLERGDWVVPTYNAALRPHKPVLLYWAMMASYMLFGVTEFGARLPSAVAGVGTVLLCYQIGRRLYDRSAAFAAGLLLSTALMFAVLSRAATPDAILILCSTASFFFFVRGVATARGGHFSRPAADGQAAAGQTCSLDVARIPLKDAAGMYAAMGFAMLAKGPIGILLPLTVIGTYAVFFMQCVDAETPGEKAGRWMSWWPPLRRRVAPRHLIRSALAVRMLPGIAIAAGVALPWYTAVTLTTGGQWLTGFIGTHNVHRFLHPMEGHSGPIFYYVVAIMAGFFPGSCFLPAAVFGAIRAHRRSDTLAHSHAFLLCWVGGYLAFFSLAATKLPNYIVPCFPALALLTGHWLITCLGTRGPERTLLRLGMASFAVIGLVMTVGLAVATVLYLDANLLVVIAGLAPLAGGVIALLRLRKNDVPSALATFAVSCVLFTILCMSLAASQVSPFQTSPRVARHLAAIDAATDEGSVRFATYHYTKPNVVFYLGKPVPTLASDDEAAEFLSGGEENVLVLPQEVYENLRPRLRPDVCVISAEPEFMKPEEGVVIVGHHAHLARLAPNGTATRR